MKTKHLAFSRSYDAALRRHLKQPSKSKGDTAAKKLGLRALKLGLSTPDLAQIHQECLLGFLLPFAPPLPARESVVRRGMDFLGGASDQIERSGRARRAGTARLTRIIGTLTQRTGQLAASNEKLRREIAERKSVESSLRTSEQTTSRLLQQSRLMQEELRLLSRRLLSVQEEERKRISRELHDVVAQTLTGIKVRLAMLKAESTASTRDLHRKIATAQRLVLRSVEIVHRFARDLRPTVLDDLGLIPAIQSYLKIVREDSGLKIRLTTFKGIEKLDGEAKTVLYRVLQESLSNVVQHANATHVTVRLNERHGTVCMDVHDNGRGFELKKAPLMDGGKRLGLLGMRERVEMVGGAFCVKSAPGRQTTVRVSIPHQKPKDEKPCPEKPAGRAKERA